MKDRPPLAELTQLLRRVEAADRVDEQLCHDICDTLRHCLNDHEQASSASLDAAIGLLVRLLPERKEIRLRISYDRTDAAIVSDPFTEGGTEFGFGRTPALALLSALLRGLISESERAIEGSPPSAESARRK